MKTVHSLWAILVLLVLSYTVINAVISLIKKKEFTHEGFRLGLMTLITTHTQLLIGLAWYFMSPWFKLLITNPVETMRSSEARLLAVEHPLIMIFVIVLITIGWSKHKKQVKSSSKFKTFTIFYGLGLLLLLSRIPWSNWVMSIIG